MNDNTRLSRWQRVRTRLHLLVTALRKRLTVGVRTVLIDGDKVLLVKHTYTPGWQFPGGGVEPGETAEAAAAREALEETGYQAEGRPELAGFYLNRIAGGMRDHVAVYVWRQFRRERAFRANLEIAQCEWFDIHALPPDVGKGTAAPRDFRGREGGRRMVRFYKMFLMGYNWNARSSTDKYLRQMDQGASRPRCAVSRQHSSTPTVAR